MIYVPATPPTTCPAGIYGLAGDWGPGSLLANTGHNRAIIRLRYPLRAQMIIHNIRPARCS